MRRALAAPLLLALLAPTLEAQDPVRVRPLGNSLHRIVVRADFSANVVALTGPEGVLLVDSGFRQTAPALAEALGQLGAGAVRHILHTHDHGDHVGGDALLGRGARIAAPGEPCELVFAGERVRAIPIPGGHSATDTAIHFERAGVLCLGDAYLSESFPIVATGRGGCAHTLMAHLAAMRERFPPQTIVVPGHGRPTTIAELDRYIAHMRATIAIVLGEMACDRTMAAILAVRPLADYAAWGHYFAFIDENRWIRNIYLSDAGQGTIAPAPPDPHDRRSPPDLSLHILFNDHATHPELATGWGFACLVEGLAEPLLFDTGLEPAALRANFATLRLEPESVAHVVLSHAHRDHTGGLSLLQEREKPPAIHTLPAPHPREILPGVLTTGEMGWEIPEQGLVIDTTTGLVILTGCAHPGIVPMVCRAKQLRHRPVRMVLGGFHMGHCTDEEIHTAIAALEALGVQKLGATHCTGERAIELFAEAWGADFVHAPCGATIQL